MENNRRGNKQMQSVMHELSHGSNAPKKRLGIAPLLLIIPIFSFLPLKTAEMICGITFLIYYLFNYKVENNEPKTENKNNILLNFDMPKRDIARRDQILVNLKNRKHLYPEEIVNSIIVGRRL